MYHHLAKATHGGCAECWDTATHTITWTEDGIEHFDPYCKRHCEAVIRSGVYSGHAYAVLANSE